MIIRRETKDAVDEVHALNEPAFGQSLEASIVDKLRSNGKGLLSLVAEENRTWTIAKRREQKMTSLIYGICLALLLFTNVAAEEVNAVHVDVLAKSSVSWDGSRLPDYPKGAPEVSILRITIPPGVQLPLHKHPVINAGVLLSGELTVVTEDNRTLHLKAGDPIVEVVNTWHYGKNEGNTIAEILVIYAGAPNTQITIKK